MRSIHFGVLTAVLLTAGQEQSSDVAVLLRLEAVWNDAHVNGDADAAVINGRLQRSRRMGERIAEDNWFFTKTFVRRDGGWQVVSWHASDVPR